MKKFGFILFVIAFAFGLECNAQYSAKKVVFYGTVRDDGYYKITQGAFWRIRPEAKIIFEGGEVEGYTRIVLDRASFVRFVDKEHNQLDKNYIVFPEGEIVYSNNKTGKFYSAKCGNEIEYIGKVSSIEILPEKVAEEQKIIQLEQGIVADYGGGKKIENQLPVNPIVPNINPEIVKKKFFQKRGVKIGCFVIGAGGVGGVLYAILHKGASAPHGTMSGGRPYTPPTTDGSGGRGN
ncbi:MAG: hypothetical protein WCI91_04115 [Candidatus Nomurabacteria bacterium]